MAYEREAKIVLSHQQAVMAVRRSVQRYARDRWNGLGSYRDEDIERFVKAIVPVVESGQVRITQLTNSYLDSLARLARKPTTQAATGKVALRGVETADVYRRPAVTLYTALKEGKSLDEAISLAGNRLDQLIAMDMQMSNVHASHEKLSGDPNIVGYERVLSPGENCALCAIASTQRYHSADLMPIHDNCACDVVPIYGKSDPGRVINAERLKDVQEQLKEQGVEYSRNGFKSDRSIRVNVHGEHGPVLGWADQNFTGPSDL